MKARHVDVGLAAVVLLALAFGGGMTIGEQHGSRTNANAPAEPAVSERLASTDPGHSSPTAASASGPATPAWPALPPASARVAEVFDELAGRARGGDVSAACRLARDLQRCTFSLAQRELASNLQDRAARDETTSGRMVDALVQLERRRERITEDCDGLQTAQLAQAFEFQRQAALARPELRTWFALNPALDRRDFVTDLERWAEYRRYAMPWLEAAARQGDAVALIALARVHGDLRRDSPPWPPFRIDDPVRALAYHQTLIALGVAQRGLQSGLQHARERLDAAGLVRAENFADSLLASGRPRLSAAALDAAMQRSFDPVPTPSECTAGS